MSYVYLAGPYSGAVEREDRNYARHLAAAAVMCKHGVPVFSPIVQSHPMCRVHGMGGAWADWAALDREYIGAARELWVLKIPGYLESVGVRAEVGRARELGLRVVWVALDQLSEACAGYHARWPEADAAAESVMMEEQEV